ncbi:MAG: PspC domain-containing protein [Bacteroidales bacterium]|jgi:phage shock protein PspC (stress-responsive transcriptional regulator)|nr:PspC domain-containing protein [Bacteroidales bacterium]HBL71955.1 hypothetical protein [Bacteroidales bacterium]
MKKTLSVNLGGTVFHIDEDAYASLTAYLNEVKHHLGDEASAEEVLNDIEHRMGELFNEWMQGRRQVVTMADVKKVIDILGRPEQYDTTTDNASDTTSGDTGSPRNEEQGYTRYEHRRRKLYRDPEGAVLGGVTTGLSKFFGVSEVFFRLGFILLTFFGLSGVLMYILCWIVIPEAITASQRLEMEGEDVTIDNIEKKVKEEFDKARGRVSNLVDNAHIEQNARSIGHGLGRFFVILAKGIVGLFSGIIGLVGFILLMVLLFVLIAMATGSVTFLSDWFVGCYPLEQLLHQPSTAVWVTLGLILVIAIPFISLFVLLFGRSLNLKPTPKWLSWTALILWLAGVALIIFAGLGFFTHYGVWCW